MNLCAFVCSDVLLNTYLKQRVGDNAVAELNDPDPHVFVPMVRTHVLVHEANGKVLEDVATLLVDGSVPPIAITTPTEIALIHTYLYLS